MIASEGYTSDQRELQASVLCSTCNTTMSTGGSRQSHHHGYRPIQPPRVYDTLPEKERQRAQTRRQNIKNMKTYKILLIGESGVGKSTLVARLCEDRFLAESRQHTLGELTELTSDC